MPTINELRFIERGGKRILQQYKYTELYQHNAFGVLCPTTEWQDVPFITTEELQK